MSQKLPLPFPKAEDCPRHEIFPGVWISTWWGENVMCSLVEMRPGAVVARHEHPHEQIGLVLAGRALFRIGEVESELTAGDRYIIPSNVPHEVIASAEGLRALDVFCPPRREYQ
ncbi:MAG: cupin domain-containing protein [Gemmatales bacterium]|nr:cupin domain-containing protein [Gemmatales bacterium]MCS7161002.1 cupin domain-containing protein [Gemmatales bacterium]MDW8176205.1 cupin domain-containing protein [Gemmatales bacterium]MDW8222659.1 cupin domain-containing protein [Gemmatales bacterium]